MAGLKRSAADNGASLGTGLFKKYKASNLVDPLSSSSINRQVNRKLPTPSSSPNQTQGGHVSKSGADASASRKVKSPRSQQDEHPTSVDVKGQLGLEEIAVDRRVAEMQQKLNHQTAAWRVDRNKKEEADADLRVKDGEISSLRAQLKKEKKHSRSVETENVGLKTENAGLKTENAGLRFELKSLKAAFDGVWEDFRNACISADEASKAAIVNAAALVASNEKVEKLEQMLRSVIRNFCKRQTIAKAMMSCWRSFDRRKDETIDLMWKGGRRMQKDYEYELDIAYDRVPASNDDVDHPNSANGSSTEQDDEGEGDVTDDAAEDNAVDLDEGSTDAAVGGDHEDTFEGFSSENDDSADEDAAAENKDSDDQGSEGSDNGFNDSGLGASLSSTANDNYDPIESGFSFLGKGMTGGFPSQASDYPHCNPTPKRLFGRDFVQKGGFGAHLEQQQVSCSNTASTDISGGPANLTAPGKQPAKSDPSPAPKPPTFSTHGRFGKPSSVVPPTQVTTPRHGCEPSPSGFNMLNGLNPAAVNTTPAPDCSSSSQAAPHAAPPVASGNAAAKNDTVSKDTTGTADDDAHDSDDGQMDIVSRDEEADSPDFDAEGLNVIMQDLPWQYNDVDMLQVIAVQPSLPKNGVQRPSFGRNAGGSANRDPLQPRDSGKVQKRSKKKNQRGLPSADTIERDLDAIIADNSGRKQTQSNSSKPRNTSGPSYPQDTIGVGYTADGEGHLRLSYGPGKGKGRAHGGLGGDSYRPDSRQHGFDPYNGPSRPPFSHAPRYNDDMPPSRDYTPNRPTYGRSQYVGPIKPPRGPSQDRGRTSGRADSDGNDRVNRPGHGGRYRPESRSQSPPPSHRRAGDNPSDVYFGAGRGAAKNSYGGYGAGNTYRDHRGPHPPRSRPLPQSHPSMPEANFFDADREREAMRRRADKQERRRRR